MASTINETQPGASQIDPLDHLEARIQKAVALVIRLRQEKDALETAAAEEKASLDKSVDALRVSLEEVRNANAELAMELDILREEKQQVRTRLEKLLGHIDTLDAV